MTKEFMKLYHMPFKAQEIKDDDFTNFRLQMDQAFEEMTKSFVKQQDEAIINYLYKKYKDTKVSDVWVLSKPDFEKFLLEMLPKWKGNNFKDSKEFKIEIPESSLMDYNPVKQYLKWEDLEFGKTSHKLKAKMNDSLYRIEWFIDGMGFKTVNIYLYVTKDYLEFCTYLQDDKKQFFNDLHLERVEE